MAPQALAGQVQAQHGRLVPQRPVGHEPIDVVEVNGLDGHVALLHTLRTGRDGGETRRQVDEGVLVADSGRVPGSDEQLPARGREPGLLGELAACRGFGLLAVLVARPGHDLQHLGVDGRPVLPHQRHRAVVVDGDDRDGTRVPDDDPIEGLAGGVDEVQTVHPEQPSPQELLLGDTAESRHEVR